MKQCQLSFEIYLKNTPESPYLSLLWQYEYADAIKGAYGVFEEGLKAADE
jgi:hypothetical protein